MQLKENYIIDFVINAGGKAYYKTDEILLDSEARTSITKNSCRNFKTLQSTQKYQLLIWYMIAARV
jgi:hypothetical protein